MKNKTIANRQVMDLNKKVGSLELISGPMFSGKSSMILQKLLIDAEIGFRVVYINHSSDTRSSGPFSTHNSLYKETTSKVDFLSSSKLKDLTSQIREYDFIGIDEAQFFDDLSEVVHWVETLGKKVIVAGLTGDFQRKRFGHLLDLEPLADVYTRLTSYCLPCARSERKKITDALFTHRVVKRDVQVHVGGAESYIPVCRSCYIRLNS